MNSDRIEDRAQNSRGLVLVTGISGFLGGHIARALLLQGYAVRGSLRTMARADEVRAALVRSGADVSRLDFCRLDLLDNAGWEDAAAGCRYVQHTASPFVLTMPKDPDEFIAPAVAGTRRVVSASLKAGTERVVLTSSLAAIDGGHHDYSQTFRPGDWTDLDGPHVTAYAKSKTLAERAAWSVADAADARNRLAVINPGTILGPLITDDPGTSAGVIQRMLRGEMPMIPNLILPYVHVADVANAHVAAMTSGVAAGQRTLVTNAATPLATIAAILRDRLGDAAAKVPTRRMPAWFARLFAMVDPSLRDSRTYLGIKRRYDIASGCALIGGSLRSIETAVEDTARSLIERALA